MPSPSVICLGGAAIDRKLRLMAPLATGSSNPVSATLSAGGVARNVCEALARLGVPAALASVVGTDAAGQELLVGLAAAGADVSLVATSPREPTAEYTAILRPDGGLVAGLAAMAVLDGLDPEWLAALLAGLDRPRWLFAEANLPAPTLAALVDARREASWRLAVDPVSVAKAARLPPDLRGVDLLLLNRDEAAALVGPGDGSSQASQLLSRGAGAVVLTDGAGPVRVAERTGSVLLPVAATPVVDVTGAGDALIAATLAGLVAGRTLVDAVERAIPVASLTAAAAETVRGDLRPQLLSGAGRSAA